MTIKELNRRYIGFEKDPEYCKIISKRLSQQSLSNLSATPRTLPNGNPNGEFNMGYAEFQNRPLQQGEIKSKEVKMEKAKIEKTKADTLREEKKARELEKQKKERLVHEIMDKISALGKSYEERVFEVAVGRWKNQKTDKRSAEREIAEAQRKLEEVKRRYAK